MRNLFPMRAIFNAVNSGWIYVVCLRQDICFEIARTNKINLFNGELVTAVSFFACLSIFIGSINHIVFMCSQEQMGSIYATTIITLMTNHKSFLDFAIFQNPRNAVRVPSFALAISAFKNRASPFPASVWTIFIDVLPKSYFEWYSHRFPVTFFASFIVVANKLRAILAGMVFIFSSFFEKYFHALRIPYLIDEVHRYG